MKHWIEDHPNLFAMLVIVLLFGCIFLAWVAQSYFEAQSYNRITGENVSTWDALWVELRIQASPKGGP